MRTRFAVAALLWVACGGQPLEPNGKDHVLHFVGAEGVLGEGLSMRVTIPHAITLTSGCGKLDFTCDKKPLLYELGGTSLELTPIAGLAARAEPVTPDSAEFVVSCTQAGSGTVGVRVVETGGSARYSDTLLVSCVRAASFEVATQYPHYARSAPVSVKTKLYVGSSSTEGLVGGSGWTVEDPGQTLSPHLIDADAGPNASRDEVLLEAMAPGGGAVLHAGSASAALPFDVLADDAWTLSMTVEHSCGAASASARLSGVAGDGKPVGLPATCGLYAELADGGTHDLGAARACDACTTPPTGTLRYCAMFQDTGKTVCSSL